MNENIMPHVIFYIIILLMPVSFSSFDHVFRYFVLFFLNGFMEEVVEVVWMRK